MDSFFPMLSNGVLKAFRPRPEVEGFQKLFTGIDNSASGMTAEQFRMDVIANNIANVNTTRTEQGGAYRRQRVIFSPRESQLICELPVIGCPFPIRYNGRGVNVVAVTQDTSPLRKEYRPEHPDADKDGYVQFPNVNVVTEMVDMITATRAYEANVSAMRSAKQMMIKALDIAR